LQKKKGEELKSTKHPKKKKQNIMKVQRVIKREFPERRQKKRKTRQQNKKREEKEAAQRTSQSFTAPKRNGELKGDKRAGKSRRGGRTWVKRKSERGHVEGGCRRGDRSNPPNPGWQLGFGGEGGWGCDRLGQIQTPSTVEPGKNAGP